MKAIINGKPEDIRALWMEEHCVVFIEQRKLPGSLEFFRAKTVDDVAYAIREMIVRGAPAIGAAGAYGMAVAQMTGIDLDKSAELLKSTRPTAYDLFYAIDKMMDASNAGEDLVFASKKYADEIADKCQLIGENGSGLIKSGAKILTHCNAGALATVDYGTALAPMRAAHEQGKNIFVFVDETRPWLQGSRLTAWELLQEGIPHSIIADNASGHFMHRGDVDLVIVGADRIASNGDFANKIGTYSRAVVAKENNIPFYVAAPVSTFDMELASGDEIPIEERDSTEVLMLAGECMAPKGCSARNPVFDVTPAKYVTGIITEKGIFEPEEIAGKMK